ncbi:hypothetical protein [Polymorphum gilvum]|uniref:Uncharacterized protein n=1 Tax=Polymorphum gilvum (strain LMG 25793 / CGMCC 1.9160 / SL003B-26A1) TaxID=991905 RepID=F2J3E9_POLGS|nr:hypothetical protein [Polymorphum gilvum]ADZ70974.1 hypothetical protein SL003B_2550 [Polymorphum gilvum SL003B-26A1]
MQFSIDVDAGTVISGWVVLENPGEIPTIIVEAGDNPPFELPANVNRPDLKDVGLHATGMAGFQIDGSIVPNVESLKSICLREKISNIEIYRRFDIKKNLERRVFVYTFSSLSQREMIRSITRKFSSSYLNIERYPYETINAILNSPTFRSVVCIGRPSYMRYAGALAAQGFFKSALLRDPFEELAERLLLLRLASRTQNPTLVEQQLSGFMQLRPFVDRLDFNSDRDLRFAFRALTMEQKACISNPVTRILACEIGEMAERRHVGLALDHLSKMELVGTMTQFEAFRTMFNSLLGEEIILHAEHQDVKPVSELAKRLSGINTVVQLIEHDLALYSYAEEAVLEGVSTWNADIGQKNGGSAFPDA